MIKTIAVIGPGRLGTALARRWAEADYEFLGFVGRDPQRLAVALEFCGAGEALSFGDLHAADHVLIATGDDDLVDVVKSAAEFPAPRPGSLWFHASGFHSVGLLEPIRRCGASVGVLHPLCPIPDFTAGYEVLGGAPATTDAGEVQTHTALQTLAARAGMRPIRLDVDVDRRKYHAACALAANGLTALHDLVTETLSESLSPLDAKFAASALIGAAAALCSGQGARAALSGPVLRGDHGVVAAHLEVLRGSAAEPAYRALMGHAVEIARDRETIDRATADALVTLLRSDG